MMEMKSQRHVRIRTLGSHSINMDSPFKLFERQAAENVFAHDVERLDDFESLGERKPFCTEKSSLHIQPRNRNI